MHELKLFEILKILVLTKIFFNNNYLPAGNQHYRAFYLNAYSNLAGASTLESMWRKHGPVEEIPGATTELMIAKITRLHLPVIEKLFYPFLAEFTGKCKVLILKIDI